MEEIIFKNATFNYGSKDILKNISIRINHPGIYALVGENGSGKTTFLNLILGILPQKGITSPGKDKMSFMMLQNGYNNHLSVKDELKWHAYLRNINKNRINEVINLCDLDKYKDYKMKKLSLGNVQKVLIAKALMEDKQAYIFDEPLNGLDPKAIMMFRDIVKDLKEQGKIIIISSHILKELDDIADYIIHIKDKHVKLYNKKNIDNIEELFI